MKNILVFFGGKSCEHEISIITGVLTLNSLDKTCYNPIPVYVSKSGEWLYGEDLFDVAFYKYQSFKKLKKVTLLSNEPTLYYKGKKPKKLCDIYCAINCMHGLNGEDGTLAGLLKFHKIPLVGAPLFSSSLSMDKDYTKKFLKGIKVETLPYVSYTKSEYIKGDSGLVNVENKIGYPLIIKPANLGSSIGISTANNRDELELALKKAFTYDSKVIIERFLTSFDEFNIAVCKMDGDIVLSGIEKPSRSQNILTFDDKYQNYSGNAEREFPAKISTKLQNKIESVSKKIYEEGGFSGIVRLDFIFGEDKIYLNEINTVPGSMAYYLFTDSLKVFSAMLSNLIRQSVKDFNLFNSSVFSYSSGVLKINGSKGSKRLTSKN